MQLDFQHSLTQCPMCNSEIKGIPFCLAVTARSDVEFAITFSLNVSLVSRVVHLHNVLPRTQGALRLVHEHKISPRSRSEREALVPSVLGFSEGCICCKSSFVIPVFMSTVDTACLL